MTAHSTRVRQEALALLRGGATNVDVARRLGVPYGTVGYWRHVDRAAHEERAGDESRLCPRCDGRDLADAHLLGLYLGDGYISHSARLAVPSFQITMDDAWPGLQDMAEASMRAVFPGRATCRVRGRGSHHLKVYFAHIDCLFPQHGPGKKHDRTITLEPWQRVIVEAHPWEFLRGLIHSDGCRVTNWTEKIIGGEPKRYEYPRYFFGNRSADIVRLLTETLDRVGVAWKTCNNSRAVQNISIARRASVAPMDVHIGPKA